MTKREKVSNDLHRLYGRYADEPIPVEWRELLAKLK